MKQFFLALLLVLSVSPFARADEASKRAKIEEIIRITKMDQLMDKTTGQMMARMKAMTDQQTAGLKLSAEQQKSMDDFQAQVRKIMAESLSWDKMKPVMVQVYSETYTDDELDGILAFYHTPSGQALIAKTPELMGRIMELVQKQMVDVQPKIQQAVEDFSHRMKELGPPPAQK